TARAWPRCPCSAASHETTPTARAVSPTWPPPSRPSSRPCGLPDGLRAGASGRRGPILYRQRMDCRVTVADRADELERQGLKPEEDKAEYRRLREIERLATLPGVEPQCFP